MNHDGAFDKHDVWTQTDANGNYRFANLAPGTYTVRVAPEPSYKPTTRTSYTITLAAANTSSHKNFGQKAHSPDESARRRPGDSSAIAPSRVYRPILTFSIR